MAIGWQEVIIEKSNKMHDKLLECVRFAGGVESSFCKKELHRMSAWELIEAIAPNDINFVLNRKN